MRATDVAIIDYGLGNLLNVQRAFEYCGAKAQITSDPNLILTASRVVLPGVGAFGVGMESLNKKQLSSVIREVALRSTPLLGICLGMQMFLDESEEFGKTKGLGLIPGRVVPIPTLKSDGKMQKIPHIGWSSVVPSLGGKGWNHLFLDNISPGDAVYFVHSYMAEPLNSQHRIADCNYGGNKVCAAIGYRNILGCQFHPEKSGEVGLNLLRRFLLSSKFDFQ